MAESDTGLLLYCITDASSALPDEGRGVRGGRLQRVVDGGLAAVVERIQLLADV